MGFFITMFLLAGLSLLSQILRPKPDNQGAKAPSLGDFRFPTATEERVVPLVWGTVKLQGPNVVWYGDLRREAIKRGGGLFGGGVTVGFRFFIGIQFALSRGPLDNIFRIWAGDKLAWEGDVSSEADIFIDEPELFGGEDLGQGGVQGTLAFFRGTESQEASAYLSQFQQQGGDTPAYRGTAYCVWEQGFIGTNTQIQPWSFEVRRLARGPSGAALGVNGDADSNPAFVLFEILTNDEWGLGFPTADIDIATFNAAATTLQNEGNGFSMIVDQPTELGRIVELIQEQIDGTVFIDPATGKWRIQLVRDDFDIETIPQIDETNLVEIEEFTRGAWADTTNFVTFQFVDRDLDYFGTYAMAQDMASMRIRGLAKSNLRFPGVKNATLANILAWRELRVLAFPLAKATITVNREFWNAVPGDPVKITATTLGVEDLVMRVTQVDTGSLTDGVIRLSLIQDVFAIADGSFAPPQGTRWEPPFNQVVPIPTDESVAFEAPKKFIELDPDFITNGLPNRVWAGARNQGDGAVEFGIRTRTGTDPFVTERTVQSFLRIGTLAANLPASTTNTAITLIPDPDMVDVFEAVDDVINGRRLSQLILVDDEFMLVGAGSGNDIENVFRGVLDSAAASHEAGADVFLLLLGGGIGDRTFQNGDVVDVKLIPRSEDTQLDEADAQTLQAVMQDRHLRPYPPIGLTMNGSVEYPTNPVSLDANGSLDDSGISVGFIRRDFDEDQENARHLEGDAAPSNNTTIYRVRVFESGMELFAENFNGGANTVFIDRTKVLRFSGGVPSELRADVETRHMIGGDDFDALQPSSHTFPVSSDLSGYFFFGVLQAGDISSSWTAPDTGDYGFDIGTTNSGGTIEARINGGAWQQVIASGASTGTLSSVTAGDIVEVRATGLDFGSTRDETIVEVIAPSNPEGAFAIFVA